MGLPSTSTKGDVPKDPLDRLLGQRLKQLREERGWTPERLGEGVGASATQILRYEAAESRLSTNRLFRISRLLGVSPMAFYDDIVQLDADGRLSQPPGPSGAPSPGETEPTERADQRLLRGLIGGNEGS